MEIEDSYNNTDLFGVKRTSLRLCSLIDLYIGLPCVSGFCWCSNDNPPLVPVVRVITSIY